MKLADSWTEERIAKACVWIGERLAADFEGTGLPEIEFRIDPAWQYGRRRRKAAAASPDDVIVVYGGHEAGRRSADREPGNGAASRRISSADSPPLAYARGLVSH